MTVTKLLPCLVQACIASLQRAGWGTRPLGAAVAVGPHAYATALAKNAHVSQSEELWVGLTYKIRNHPM